MTRGILTSVSAAWTPELNCLWKLSFLIGCGGGGGKRERWYLNIPGDMIAPHAAHWRIESFLWIQLISKATGDWSASQIASMSPAFWNVIILILPSNYEVLHWQANLSSSLLCHVQVQQIPFSGVALYVNVKPLSIVTKFFCEDFRQDECADYFISDH